MGSPMTDPIMLQVAPILADISLYSFLADPITSTLAFCKLLQITLEYGMCTETALAYSGYAQVLSIMGHDEEAYRFSELALRAMTSMNRIQNNYDSFNSNADLAESSASMHYIRGLCSHLKSPLAQLLDPSLHAYRTSLERGDVFFGMLCLFTYCHLYLMCGLPLAPFVADGKNFAAQLKLFGYDQALGSLLPHLLFAKNMSGQSDDPLDMSWKGMEKLGYIDEDSKSYVAATFCKASKSPKRLMVLYYHIWIAYMMDDLDAGAESLDAILNMPKNNRKLPGTHYFNYLFNFMDGAMGYKLFAKTKQRKYRSLADKALECLTKSQITMPRKRCTTRPLHPLFGPDIPILVPWPMKKRRNSCCGKMTTFGRKNICKGQLPCMENGVQRSR